MQAKILDIADGIRDKTITRRRFLHKHAESAWTEFLTTSHIVKTLSDLGFEVLWGEDVISREHRAAVPDEAVLEACYQRALEEGADETIIEKARGGYTGAIGILRNGDGPTVALRFDIDALEITESSADTHEPVALGFSSIHEGAAHLCGHDGHTSIGLAVAEVLSGIRDHFRGTLKIIFQPGEEGMRGAKPMVEKGHLDDVDYLIGLHIGVKALKTGMIIAGSHGFLATSKIDAVFKGKSAHAGLAPEQGANALLAAATAVTNLHAIVRHGKGSSRVNVGSLTSRGARNAIPETAELKLETRGITSEVNEFMENAARAVLKGAAVMHGVDVKIEGVGSAKSGASDAELIAVIKRAAGSIPNVTEIADDVDFGACEDFTFMMDRVQQGGGKATYLMVGSKLADGHHSPEFTFDEESLSIGTRLVALAVYDLMKP